MRIADDLSCAELVELVTEYLEGSLAVELRTAIERHLEVCDGCRLYLGQMRLTIRALHGLQRDPGPRTLADTLLRQFRALRAEPRMNADRDDPSGNGDDRRAGIP